MAERIARPPIRLGAGFPDGQLMGATDKDVTGFLAENPDGAVIDRYALVRLVRRQTTRSDETLAEVAILRVAAIELLPDDVVQPIAERISAAEWMAQLRAERLGDNTLDFASAAQAESLAEIRDKVHLWANEAEVPPEELAAEIRKVVPNVPDDIDVLRDVKVLSEFLTIIREREDDEFDAAVAASAPGGKTDVKTQRSRSTRAGKAPEPVDTPQSEE